MNPNWIRCEAEPGAYSPLRLSCFCTMCGDRWVHDCQHPGKEGVWFARYKALHAHGHAQVASFWADQYHRQLQRFNQQMRGW